MIKNYLLISARNLRKHLGYTIINITGLGLGLATCLLLVSWILHELSYDKFHEKSDRIYRASLEYGFGGQVNRTSVSPTALFPALNTLPETETAVRVYNPSAWNPYTVKYGEKFMQETRFYMADSTFFKVFTFALLKGDPATALAEPYSVVLTTSAATRYFGNDDPLGKSLLINADQHYIVTGVMKDPPSNSLLQFDFLGSFSSLQAAREEPQWWSANYQTFVAMQPDGRIADLAEKINVIASNAVGDDLKGEGDYVRYNFMLMKDIHLHSDYNGEPEVVGDIRYVYIFSAIALLILAIACINYVNLSTARAADRAKEVGIRKVAGALKKQLFIQFIGESVVITLLAFLLAYFIAQTSLPFFNQLTGKDFSYLILIQPSFIFPSLAVLVIIAILAGAYPALVITSFAPVTVLKGNFKTSGRGIWLRRALVVTQFSISVMLIVGTLVISKQLDYIQNKKLGYERENTIILPFDEKTKEVYQSFKTELIRSGAAKYVGRGSEPPTHVKGGYAINIDGQEGFGIVITGLVVDEDYVPALGMEMVAGRNFTASDLERFEKDSTAYGFLLNEAALKELYLDKDEAVGTTLNLHGRKGELLGVVKDFHFASLHTDIGPLVMFPEMRNIDKVVIKLPPGKIAAALDKIRSIAARLLPHRPFEYELLDQDYAAMYDAEQRMGKIFIVFSTLAIIIACLGLLGLVSFSAAQKTKEIGIRKVLGASATHIVLLITRDFARLVVVAIVVGLPAAYLIMQEWLKDFAYKTDIGPGPVITAPLLCLFIAFGTAAFQAIKAAYINPSETLRNE